MFCSLATAIEGLEIPDDPGALAEVLALRDRLDARIAVAVGRFEAAGLHEVDGSLTTAAWLRHRGGLDHGAAHRLAVQGRKLGVLPVLRQAFLDGRLSGGQVDVILANVRLRHVERFASHEVELVPVLTALDTDDLRIVMTDWRAKADALDDGPAPIEHPNEVYLSTTIDGRGELRGSFDSDLHALLDAGLRVADSGDFDLTPAERRADAMGTIVQHFLDHQLVRRGGRHRPHVNVVVPYERWIDGGDRTGSSARYLDTGQLVSPAELGALRCDSALHRLVTDGASAILDYGRSTRQWPVDLYNAIAARDQGCRWPGCDRPASWCDVHHLTEWEHGGRTAVDNGALLCRRHHRLLHANHGYLAKLLPDGSFDLTLPDGTTDSSRPRLTATPPFW